MTKAAQKISDEIDRLCKEYDRLDELNNPADYAKMEDLLTEIADLKEQICNNCEGEGDVLASYHSPRAIEPHYVICRECGGSGVV